RAARARLLQPRFGFRALCGYCNRSRHAGRGIDRRRDRLRHSGHLRALRSARRALALSITAMSKEPLAGGMGNRGEVLRVGDTVRRPVGDHSAAVSRLLEHLVGEGFPAPVQRGRDEEGRELFDWIEGDVPVPPYPPWSLTDDALATVGRLLRRYHDAVCSF